MSIISDLRYRLRVQPAELRRLDDGRLAIETRLTSEAERLLTEARSLPRTVDRRQLVMGLAANYGAAELAPFVLSLRGCGYGGDVVLLTYGCTLETAAFLRTYAVRMVPFACLGAMPMSMNSARMFRYLDWLGEQLLNSTDGQAYSQVLLADVRDVVFQGDPFARMPDARVAFFLEPERTIGHCPINADWMRRAYGNAVALELADQPVSCAGTIAGTLDGLLEYLAHMVKHIIAVAPSQRFSGVDQAIHNYILAKHLIDGAVAVPDGQAVATLPSITPTGARLLSDGRIANAAGQVSDIVHQYDRDAVITASVQARYRV